jgi:hypothetical protein
MRVIMKRSSVFIFAVLAGALLSGGRALAVSQQNGGPSSQSVRPLGVVTKIQPGQLTLHTDAGTDLIVDLPQGARILRVPPGAKNLASATPIAVGDISTGDRVLVLGSGSAGGKSVVAKTVIVMTKTALQQTHEAERAAWLERGIGGVVKAIDPATREITLAVPNESPTPGNPTHPVTVTLAPNAVLLRYAPDSVKFSDAEPAPFSEIEVGDQVRALGTMNAGGSKYTAEKLVSGTFRNIGATVISVDAAHDAVTVKDLATGKPLLVRTNGDSQLHRLPPFIANTIARFSATLRTKNGQPGGPSGGAQGGSRRPGSVGGGEKAMDSGPPGPPHDFQQMLEHTPSFSLSELKPGEPLIVVSTEGAKPSEVTAIAVLTGVEPILEAQPKGKKEVALGPWNMSVGGGGGEEGP